MARKFSWNQEAQVTFEELKTAFTTAAILIHFNQEQLTSLKADTLMHALDALIFQLDPEEKMHLITFYSWKFNSTKLNYNIYDKKMLAIVDSLKHYHNLFEELE